jgi:transcriptional regulator with XRE-family HTH domain
MRLTDLHTDAAVLTELGSRLTRHRLERNWTQVDLAREAGVGRATVQRAESGKPVQTTLAVRLLRTLGLLEGLDAAIPESVRLPIAQLERERRRARQRARPSRREPRPARTDEWEWRDEPGTSP